MREVASTAYATGIARSICDVERERATRGDGIVCRLRVNNNSHSDDIGTCSRVWSAAHIRFIVVGTIRVCF